MSDTIRVVQLAAARQQCLCCGVVFPVNDPLDPRPSGEEKKCCYRCYELRHDEYFSRTGKKLSRAASRPAIVT
jgi:hypothetical protein